MLDKLTSQGLGKDWRRKTKSMWCGCKWDLAKVCGSPISGWYNYSKGQSQCCSPWARIGESERQSLHFGDPGLCVGNDWQLMLPARVSVYMCQVCFCACKRDQFRRQPKNRTKLWKITDSPLWYIWGFTKVYSVGYKYIGTTISRFVIS